jgi:hypothetical protein
MCPVLMLEHPRYKPFLRTDNSLNTFFDLKIVQYSKILTEKVRF